METSKIVVFVVKQYAVREAKNWRYAVRKAKKGRYAERKRKGCVSLLHLLQKTIRTVKKPTNQTSFGCGLNMIQSYYYGVLSYKHYMSDYIALHYT